MLKTDWSGTKGEQFGPENAAEAVAANTAAVSAAAAVVRNHGHMARTYSPMDNLEVQNNFYITIEK